MNKAINLSFWTMLSLWVIGMAFWKFEMQNLALGFTISAFLLSLVGLCLVCIDSYRWIEKNGK